MHPAGRHRHAGDCGRQPPRAGRRRPGRDVVLSCQYPAIQLPTQPAAGHPTGNRPPTRRYPAACRPGQAS